MSLKEGDLQDLVDNVFEIDAYKSKMGSDKEIVVLSFSVHEKAPAQDLVNFIEKGYSFVLDADLTTGEQHDGFYKVFVEIERNKDVPEQIIEIVDGVSKLSNKKDFRFRYYKGFKSYPVGINELQEEIPLDTATYDLVVNENNMNNFKNFFNRSYVDNIEMYEDILTIKKIYADPLQFRVIDFGPRDQVFEETITESLNFNDFGEIIFLCKYVGDYNITKFGKKLTFENNGYTLVLERL
jgi:hypothetical protein